MGYFVPAIPVDVREFGERGIWFDYDRYCKPFINDEILDHTFGNYADRVKREFIITNEQGNYELEMGISHTTKSSRIILQALMIHDENRSIKQGLSDLISNVILFEEENSEADNNFISALEWITPLHSSIWNGTHSKNYRIFTLIISFTGRMISGERKPCKNFLYLKRATNMLICGEDLGMVPHCVPDVMKQLGILSLEIQRMPKETTREFFHPNDAPYLSVVTPSTHDMSTIRGWWEEDRDRTQRFFNNILGQ